MRVAPLLLFAMLVAGCSGAQTPTEPKESTLTVAFGQSVAVPGTMVTISFTDITDSRCPQSVSCVWEGDAAVRLESSGSAIVLHTTPAAGSASARLGDLTVSLVDVKPVRVTTDEIKKSEYVVTVRATH